MSQNQKRVSRDNQFLCEIAHHRKSLIAIFQDFFASTNKMFILAVGWALGYHSMKFRHFPDIF